MARLRSDARGCPPRNARRPWPASRDAMSSCLSDPTGWLRPVGPRKCRSARLHAGARSDPPRSDSDRLADEEHRRATLDPLAVRDQHLCEHRVDAHLLVDTGVLPREDVVADPGQRGIEVLDDLLGPDDEDD